MKIFISYSITDTNLVRSIANYIRPYAEVYYWDGSKVPGQQTWPMIFNWIEQSDLIIAVITDKTVSRAMSVGQEVGHARAKGKTIIPLIGPNVDTKGLGFLSGITYQRIQPENPGPALQSIEKIVLAQKQALEAKRQAMFLVGGIFALVLLLSSSEN